MRSGTLLMAAVLKKTYDRNIFSGMPGIQLTSTSCPTAPCVVRYIFKRCSWVHHDLQDAELLFSRRESFLFTITSLTFSTCYTPGMNNFVRVSWVKVKCLALKDDVCVLLYGNMNLMYADVGCQLVPSLRSPLETLLCCGYQSREGAGWCHKEACSFVQVDLS